MNVSLSACVLDDVPAGADAEPEAVARQDGQLGCLLGDEHGLALGQDQHGVTSSSVVVTAAMKLKIENGSWKATSLS